MSVIGGYFELECTRYEGLPYHDGSVNFNSARHALGCFVRLMDIKKIQIPYYTCPVVWDILQRTGCEVIPYEIDSSFMPVFPLRDDIFVLYTNYFGIMGKNVDRIVARYPKCIIDNAQAFFSPRRGAAGFYSPRKFFGVPDGGILLLEGKCDVVLEVAQSYNRCDHLLKRLDLGAEKGYEDYVRNEKALIDEPPKSMSYLTSILLGSIDYTRVRTQRLSNFKVLHEVLSQRNGISIDCSMSDVPMVYPFWSDDEKLRQKLISNKVFVARYWAAEPGNLCMTSASSEMFSKHIIPLPIDQRYKEADMHRILELL